jgi:group II intron reverse transcriptase/maturase
MGFSYGFRPGRSQHQALDAVAYGMWKKMVKWVLDADIQSFFDTLSHEWLVKFLEHRIADRRVIRLIQKWLNAGVLEDGKRNVSEIGTVQGGSISPLLANIYLHYVFDLWIEQWRTSKAEGDVLVVRFADDFVVGFQHRKEADRFLAELRERLAKFGLNLHPEKTRLVEFGRFAAANRQARGEGKPEAFHFLGFTHYCGKTWSGKFTVIRKTMRQRLLKKLKEVNIELRQRRHEPVDEQGHYVQAVIRGHVNYYGVPLNRRAIDTFRWLVIRLWYKWLNRRSQRSSVDWDRMQCYIKRWVPSAVVCHPYPSVRFGG